MEKIYLSIFVVFGVFFVVCSGLTAYYILNSKFNSQIEERFIVIKREFKQNIANSTLDIRKDTLQDMDISLTENYNKIANRTASPKITMEGFPCQIYTGNGTLHTPSKLVYASTLLLDSRIEILESILAGHFFIIINISKGEIKGRKGDPGTGGTPGMKGAKGSQGQTGPQGQQGTSGIKGIKGEQGMIGSTGIRGVKGVHGPVGNRGDKGEIGIPGISGKKGIPGEPGRSGLTGFMGVRGPRGVKGQKGEKGPTGRKGDKGLVFRVISYVPT